MAIRIREGRNKPFQVYWRNPMTEKLESKSFAKKEEAEKFDALTKYQLKYERDEFRPEDLTQPEPEIQTLESILYLYLRDRKLKKENLERCLFAIQGILDKYGDTEIEKVDKQLLVEMQKASIVAGNKGSTVQRKVGIIKAALNWAHRNGFIQSLPVFPASPKSEPARYIPPTQEEIGKIYKAASPHLQRVILLGFMFGLRVGPCELLKLKWSDVDLPGAVIRVPNAQKGIGVPWREVPIPSNLNQFFTKWRQEDEGLGIEYVVHYNGKPVKHVKTSWQRALKKAGIARHIRPYDLRHAFATEAIASGADYGTVASLMGHKSPVMVMRHYQHVKNQQKVKTMEKLVQPELVAALV